MLLTGHALSACLTYRSHNPGVKITITSNPRGEAQVYRGQVYVGLLAMASHNLNLRALYARFGTVSCTCIYEYTCMIDLPARGTMFQGRGASIRVGCGIECIGVLVN